MGQNQAEDSNTATVLKCGNLLDNNLFAELPMKVREISRLLIRLNCRFTISEAVNL
jgi:hypothetical protein